MKARRVKKNKEIEQAEKELHKIEEEPSPELRFEPMKEWTKKYGAHHSPPPSYSQPEKMVEWVRDTLEIAHRFLQTKMMVNACTTARSSCKWAAIAATVAAIGVVLGCYTYLFKMIILMFKSIF